MEHVERHFLYKVLNGDKAVVDVKDQKLFSIEFNRYNNLINEMRSLGLEDINEETINIYSQMEKVSVNENFPQLSPALKGNTQEIINMYINKKKRTLIEDELRHVILNDKVRSPETLKKIRDLSEQLKAGSEYKPRTFKEVLPEQVEFIRDIFDGKEADGIYLYRPNRSRQFIKMSYMLKYIADTDLVILGGRPSVGKTSFMLSLMNVFSKNNYDGLMISLEMTATQVLHRMATAKSGISNNDIFNLKKPDPAIMSQYFSGLNAIGDLNVKIVDEPVSSWLEIKRTIIENLDTIDYVIIDHLTYIPSYDGNEVGLGHATVSNIIRDMKQTAKEYKIPIIVLAQFSRGLSSSKGGKRQDTRYVEPYAHDFRESGSIEEYADKILLLYRKEHEEGEKYNQYKIACKIDKNRAGKTGELTYMFYADINRWKEVESFE